MSGVGAGGRGSSERSSRGQGEGALTSEFGLGRSESGGVSPGVVVIEPIIEIEALEFWLASAKGREDE